MHTLYNIYTFIIAGPIFFVISVLVSLAVVFASILGDTTYTAYYLPRLWAKCACRLYLHKVEVIGRENIDPHQSYIFLANHQGYYDIFLVYGYLGHNFKWMMKEYLRKIPFIGLACERAKMIYVGESRASIKKAVTQAEETLRGGMSMVIFPEGTRTRTGSMGEFKRGAFMLANEINLPIVPITINGSFDILNRNSPLIHRGKLTMTIHRPITSAEREGVNSKLIMQQVYDIINADVEPAYRKPALTEGENYRADIG